MMKQLKIIIFILLISISNLTNAQKVKVLIKNDAVYFTEGKDSILKYQTAEKSFKGKYKRSNYIHPLYTFDGQILTKDFPADHLHHRGIFWAWHQLYIGDKRIGDGWEIKNFHWEVKSVKEIKNKGNAKAIQLEVLWKSNQWKDDNNKEKAVVKEITTLQVYPAKSNYRQIDIKISIYALEENMRLGGSENAKGYGGFSARIRLVNDIKFTGSTGKVTPEKLPVKADGWIDFSGSFGKGQALSGFSILSHPDNPGYPNPWILRSSGSMQNAVYPFPGAKTVTLSKIHPTILRYRLIIHKGNDKAINISALQTDFGKE